MRRLTLIPALALIACVEGEPAQPPDLDSLVLEGGCGDVTMYTASNDRDLILVVRFEDELTQAAYDEGQPVTVDVDADGSVELVQGRNVLNFYCNDALEVGAQEVETTWEAVSGSFTLTVTNTGDGEYTADAEVELLDVLLQAEGADDVHIDRMDWSAGVGWWAG